MKIIDWIFGQEQHVGGYYCRCEDCLAGPPVRTQEEPQWVATLEPVGLPADARPVPSKTQAGPVR